MRADNDPKGTVAVQLTRPDGDILRALAISAIVLHNFLHIISSVGENEFMLDPGKTANIIDSFRHPSLWLGPDILSFFGHYGVALFVFLSGFGFARKYISGLPSFVRFAAHNWLKLFWLLLPSLPLLIYYCIAGEKSWTDLPWQMSLTTAFHPEVNAWPGPMWYLPMLLQLYLLYYLVIWRVSDRVLVLTSVALMAGMLVLYRFDPSTAEFLRDGIGYGYPIFCIGVIIGRRPGSVFRVSRRWLPYVCIGLWVVTLAASMSVWEAVWQLSFLLWPVAACFTLPYIRHGRKFLVWLGGISAAVYAVHPAMREIALFLCTDVSVTLRFFIYIAGTVVGALVFALILRHLPKIKG